MLDETLPILFTMSEDSLIQKRYDRINKPLKSKLFSIVIWRVIADKVNPMCLQEGQQVTCPCKA